MDDGNRNIKLDISSTMVEKGIDAAKSFLSKLLSPAIEETGLLIKDNVTLWRFRNQVRILIKAKNICEKKGISTKSISLKLLVPLLENAALEEDEYLQDKWAILLSNLADSEQNIQNHVLPSILSQMSKQEFVALDKLFTLKEGRVLKLEQDKATKETELHSLMTNPNSEEENRRIRGMGFNHDYEVRRLQRMIETLLKQIASPIVFKESELTPIEVANLNRLGIIKILPMYSASLDEVSIPNNPESGFLEIGQTSVHVFPTGEIYHITELGNLFIAACKEKQPTE